MKLRDDILLNQKISNNRLDGFNNQHILATINIPSDSSNKLPIVLNNIPKESTLIRKYFGPVNIERLRITLYDEFGFLVNLNNHDWNFTLHVEQLYQY